MNIKQRVILCSIICFMLLLIPSAVIYAEARDSEEYNGVLLYDDRDTSDYTDEDWENYGVIDHDSYKLKLDRPYSVHAVIEPIDYYGYEDISIDLSFSIGEENVGFFENIVSLNDENKNNEIDVKLDAGNYNMQIGLGSLGTDTDQIVKYRLTLSFTELEDDERDNKLKSDIAVISFASINYNLEMDGQASYKQGSYDFYENVIIDSELEYSASDITWKSSNKAVASVDSEGTVTAYKAGTTKITAKLPNGNNASCTIIVPKPTYKINKKNATIDAGDSMNLKIVATPTNEKVKVKWSSSNKCIGSVSKTGKVNGKKSGKCVITAKLPNGKKYTCSVTVKKVEEIIDVFEYLNNASALKQKDNASFSFESSNGIVTYIKITGGKASFNGLSPGGINLANLLLNGYKLKESVNTFLATVTYYQNIKTGEKVYITESIYFITEIEYYRD